MLGAVLPLLDAASVPVMVVDLPSVSHANATLHDDADYVRGALDSITGDAVLVGHSYGGVVISEAGVHPNVAHLVYLAAFALDVGESAQENSLTGGDDANDLVAAIEFGRRRVHDQARPSRSPRSTTTARPRMRERGRSSGYGRNRCASLAGTVDRRRVARPSRRPTSCAPTTARCRSRCSARTRRASETSIDWPTSHSPFLSRPELVADLLIELSSR